MSEQSIKKDFRKEFILAFTKELIKNYNPEIILKIREEYLEKRKEEKIQRERKLKEFREKIQKELSDKIQEKKLFIKPQEEKVQISPITKPIILPPKRIIPLSNPIRKRESPGILRIPEPKLPMRLQYLTPNPSEKGIDLGKLNKYLNDPVVKTIECNGPDERIVIIDTLRKTTETTLSKEEIDEIVEKFSKATRIPIHEGIYKIAYGKFIFSAIISDVIGSKFIIKKIFYNPNFNQNRNLNSSLIPKTSQFKIPPSTYELK
jgi:hypothetical protein